MYKPNKDSNLLSNIDSLDQNTKNLHKYWQGVVSANDLVYIPRGTIY